MPLKPYIPPNEAAGGKYFGLPLSEVCSNEQPIPVYVEQCAQLIEENGIARLGIYRVSGKKVDVLNLHAKFDDGKMQYHVELYCVKKYLQIFQICSHQKYWKSFTISSMKNTVQL